MKKRRSLFRRFQFPGYSSGFPLLCRLFDSYERGVIGGDEHGRRGDVRNTALFLTPSQLDSSSGVDS